MTILKIVKIVSKILTKYIVYDRITVVINVIYFVTT